MNAFHVLPGCHVDRVCQVDPARFATGGARPRVTEQRCPACEVWEQGLRALSQAHPRDGYRRIAALFTTGGMERVGKRQVQWLRRTDGRGSAAHQTQAGAP